MLLTVIYFGYILINRYMGIYPNKGRDCLFLLFYLTINKKYMPGFDGRGPVWGGGPGSGQGFGPCGSGQRMLGMRWGRGFRGLGLRFGWRRFSKDDYKRYLEEEEKMLEEELALIREEKNNVQQADS